MDICTGNYSSIDICSCLEMNMTGGRCQPSFYCPLGSSAPISCVAGQYCADYELDAPTGKCYLIECSSSWTYKKFITSIWYGTFKATGVSTAILYYTESPFPF